MADVEDGFVDISEEQNGGLMKKILVPGSGEETPPSGSEVWVHYVGTLNADGSKFDSSRDRDEHFNFDVGVGQVIRGWDVGICSMKKDEKAILRCTSDYGYGAEGSPPTIPGGAMLDFEVELFRWREKVKQPHQMTVSERSAHAAKQKDVANAAFAAKDWATAVDGYSEGVKYITFGGGGGGGNGQGHSHGDQPCSGHGDEDDEDEEDDGGAPMLSEDDKRLAIALLNNCAVARLKVGDAELAAKDCSKALGYDAVNVKSLFRRGQSYLALGDFPKATEDAAKVLELDPENKQAELLKRSAVVEAKKAKQKEKAMYGKMFG